jgi:hypothetical protein
MQEAGKGSAPRPKSVDEDTFTSNWELAFGKKKKAEGENQAEAVIKDDSNSNNNYKQLSNSDVIPSSKS